MFVARAFRETRRVRALVSGGGTALFLTFAVTGTTFAQAVAQGAGQVAPPTSPIERAVPVPTPQAVPPLLPTPAPGAPEVPPGPPVAIQSVVVQGATAYPESELKPYYADLVGQSVPLAQISSVLQQIQNKYRNDGYVLTVVRGAIEPGSGGSTLRIRVVEGFISDVKIDGDIGPAGVLVFNFLNKLTTIRPVNISDIERALLLAQDIPGVSVRAVLRPGAGEAGAVELVGQVGRKAFGGYVQYDNRASTFAGPNELLLGAQANSFTSAGERTEVEIYDTPFTTEQLFGQGSIEGFVGSSGLKLRGYAGYGYSQPGGVLSQVDFHSRLTLAGVSASYPIIRTRPLSLYTSLAFDTEHAVTTESGGTGLRNVSDLRVLRLSSTVDSQDQTLGTGLIGANTIILTAHEGLNGLGATSDARIGNRVDFFKLTGEITRVQNLFSFGTNTVALKLSAGGQWTNDVLPPTEEYLLGGTRYGRGFFAGEVIGDNALGTTAELQLNTAIERPLPLGLQPYIFYDNGQTWNVAPAGQPPDPSQRIESAGVGVRVTVTPQLSVDVEDAHRFTRTPTGAAVSREGADVIFVTVIARF
jgi:hemolysin activation/secretion protein